MATIPLSSLVVVVFSLLMAIASACPPKDGAVFSHPGMLHTARDLARMKTNVALGHEPWASGYQVLLANPHSSLKWVARPQEKLIRGKSSIHTTENYRALFTDIAAAYALSLRWHISGEDAYADHAISILNGWSGTLQAINGTSDKFLAAGIYGYQLANAAELLRGYSKWDCAAFDAFVDMLVRVFYPMNHDFLVHHNGRKVDHYWANWDLANMASMISIGILADRKDMFDEAVEYFKHGEGNGAIQHAVWKIYADGTGQVQESGRDQPHATLVVGFLGAFCEMAFNQGEDLYAYDNNRVLAGAEYVAKYNLGYEVEYTAYTNSHGTQPVISAAGRGIVRPQWEHLYNHYVVKKKLKAPFVQQFAQKIRPEGGGGKYGYNSGGYDVMGYGTLTYSLLATSSGTSETPTPTTGPSPTVTPTVVPAVRPSGSPTANPIPTPTPTMVPPRVNPATVRPAGDADARRTPKPGGRCSAA